MGYRFLSDCITELENNGHLIRISDPIDPNLEMAEIHRRVYLSGGPALLFENPVGCKFPMASNLFCPAWIGDGERDLIGSAAATEVLA